MTEAFENDPQISVIIPVYHITRQLLRRAVDSVQKQSGVDVEIILVLDGIEEAQAAAEICNVRKITIKHSGVSAARNAGIRAANGKWIFFLDADDYLADDCLRTALLSLEKESSGPQIVLMDYSTGDENRKKYHRYRIDDTNGHTPSACTENEIPAMAEIEKDSLLRDCLIPQTGAGFVWGRLFLRSFLQQHSLYFNEKLSMAEDAEYMVRVSGEAVCAGYIPICCYHFTVRADSAVHQYSRGKEHTFTPALKEIWKDLKRIEKEKELYQVYSSCVCYHLLLTAVNTIFHPDNPAAGSGQICSLKDLSHDMPYRLALKHARYRDFSWTRRAALFCLKHRMYAGVRVISGLRHMQRQISFERNRDQTE